MPKRKDPILCEGERLREYYKKARYENGDTPLIQAIRQNNLKAINFHLTRGADPWTTNKEEKNAFDVAMEICHNTGDFTALKKIVNIPNKNGNTAMHYAFKTGNINLAYVLFYTGASILKQNNQGYTPLKYDQHGIVNNQCDGYGNILLHIAAEKGDIEAINLLLEHGANPYLQNKLGISPIDMEKSRVEVGGIESGLSLYGCIDYENDPINILWGDIFEIIKRDSGCLPEGELKGVETVDTGNNKMHRQ